MVMAGTLRPLATTKKLEVAHNARAMDTAGRLVMAKMENSRAFYRKQLNDAYKFKVQTGADYSDFTDRYDEYARMERRLSEAIRYLEGIVRSQSQQG